MGLAAASAATAAVAVTTGGIAAVVLQEQENADDEEDPRPGALVVAEQIGQTHTRLTSFLLPGAELRGIDYTPYYGNAPTLVTIK